MEFSKKGTRKDASEPWRERLSGGGGQRLESSWKIRFNVVTSLVGSIKGGFYPPPTPPGLQPWKHLSELPACTDDCMCRQVTCVGCSFWWF